MGLSFQHERPCSGGEGAQGAGPVAHSQAWASIAQAVCGSLFPPGRGSAAPVAGSLFLSRRVRQGRGGGRGSGGGGAGGGEVPAHAQGGRGVAVVDSGSGVFSVRVGAECSLGSAVAALLREVAAGGRGVCSFSLAPQTLDGVLGAISRFYGST